MALEVKYLSRETLQIYILGTKVDKIYFMKSNRRKGWQKLWSTWLKFWWVLIIINILTRVYFSLRGKVEEQKVLFCWDFYGISEIHNSPWVTLSMTEFPYIHTNQNDRVCFIISIYLQYAWYSVYSYLKYPQCSGNINLNLNHLCFLYFLLSSILNLPCIL